MRYILTTIIIFVAAGCSTLTTPLRDCKALCGGKAESYNSDGEGEHCVCKKENHCAHTNIGYDGVEGL